MCSVAAPSWPPGLRASRDGGGPSRSATARCRVLLLGGGRVTGVLNWNEQAATRTPPLRHRRCDARVSGHAAAMAGPRKVQAALSFAGKLEKRLELPVAERGATTVGAAASANASGPAHSASGTPWLPAPRQQRACEGRRPGATHAAAHRRGVPCRARRWRSGRCSGAASCNRGCTRARRGAQKAQKAGGEGCAGQAACCGRAGGHAAQEAPRLPAQGHATAARGGRSRGLRAGAGDAACAAAARRERAQQGAFGPQRWQAGKLQPLTRAVRSRCPASGPTRCCTRSSASRRRPQHLQQPQQLPPLAPVALRASNRQQRSPALQRAQPQACRPLAAASPRLREDWLRPGDTT